MSSTSPKAPNGSAQPVNGNGHPKDAAKDIEGKNGDPVPDAPMEYYILCPQRSTEVPGLITHLISRDICEKRQAENYHKCPNCIRSRIWRERNGHAPHPAAASRAG